SRCPSIRCSSPHPCSFCPRLRSGSAWPCARCSSQRPFGCDVTGSRFEWACRRVERCGRQHHAPNTPTGPPKGTFVANRALITTASRTSVCRWSECGPASLCLESYLLAPQDGGARWVGHRDLERAAPDGRPVVWVGGRDHGDGARRSRHSHP